MEILKPYLSSVEGIFLFGSFARNEQTPESDIDLLVISTKKIGLKKSDGLDFLVKTRQDFLRALEEDRTLFLHQILSEAKPILNEGLLGGLRQEQAEPKYKELLEDTLGAFKNVQELFEASEKQGLEYLDSNVTIYSLILRLRGLVSAQCIAKKQPYSNRKLASVLASHGFKQKTINDFLIIHRAEKDNKKTAVKVSVAEAEKLFDAAKTEFVKTEILVKP
jgi:predicted nucleotidyltransferase